MKRLATTTSTTTTGRALAGPLASVAAIPKFMRFVISSSTYVSDSQNSLIWSTATDAMASQRFLSWEVGNIICIAYMNLSVDQPKSRRWQMLSMERFRRPSIPKKSAIACTTVGFGDACNSHHSGIFCRAALDTLIRFTMSVSKMSKSIVSAEASYGT
ncbi:hypothetical protein PAAG_11354 [Paracoccidioides lutzii Pb01]|uniref:Uncharacterized protein n=1 Tax=Paracoccidioides lutzii (strain ATCC MYA-826 / Pb01) TaxID=502779 RepID=A0A0A2V762_PARBA|nr:hypothetical protein PAAG_11354 [Paracoccidioides lutzii Pb01]KGQ01960.1 hypothetical protein PAAG_11354 [Paracoccidioides lutzii Pb01]